MSLDNTLEGHLIRFAKEMILDLQTLPIVLTEGQRVSSARTVFVQGNYINHLYLFCQFENCTDNIETVRK